MHAALLLAWALGEFALLVASAATGGARGVLAAAGGWSLAGLLILISGLREGAGRESVAVSPPHLIHTRSFGPFTLRRRYDLARVFRPRAARVSIPPQRLYRIEFDYGGSVRRFGGRLSAAEAATVVRMIEAAREGDPETADGA